MVIINLKRIWIYCIILVLFARFGAFCAGAETYPWLRDADYHSGQSIAARVPEPEGYKRIQVPEDGFGAWLRGLPLRLAGFPVRLYPVLKGQTQTPSYHHAVVYLDVLKFQECADAIIRLRAEYLWSVGQADRICFNFTSNDPCCWKAWKSGLRPVVEDNKVVWKKSSEAVSTRCEFMIYLNKVMEYAGTASLQRELVHIPPDQLTIGDVIIQAGYPGHALLVVDMAQNRHGGRLMLLGQGFMPAQEFHLLRNPGDKASPWFEVRHTGSLKTPQWPFHVTKDCRRFGPME